MFKTFTGVIINNDDSIYFSDWKKIVGVWINL